MSERVTVPDTVYDEADRISDERDMSIKEAIRQMCREGGYDV